MTWRVMFRCNNSDTVSLAQYDSERNVALSRATRYNNESTGRFYWAEESIPYTDWWRIDDESELPETLHEAMYVVHRPELNTLMEEAATFGWQRIPYNYNQALDQVKRWNRYNTGYVGEVFIRCCSPWVKIESLKKNG